MKIREFIERPFVRKEVEAVTCELRKLLPDGKFKDNREFFIEVNKSSNSVKVGHHQFTIDDSVVSIAKVLLHINFNDIFKTTVFDFNDYSSKSLFVSLVQLRQTLKVLSRV